MGGAKIVGSESRIRVQKEELKRKLLSFPARTRENKHQDGKPLRLLSGAPPRGLAQRQHVPVAPSHRDRDEDGGHPSTQGFIEGDYLCRLADEHKKRAKKGLQVALEVLQNGK